MAAEKKILDGTGLAQLWDRTKSYSENKAEEKAKEAVSSAISANIRPNTVTVADSDGVLSSSSVTSAELGALSGISGNIQERLDAISSTGNATYAIDESVSQEMGLNWLFRSDSSDLSVPYSETSVIKTASGADLSPSSLAIGDRIMLTGGTYPNRWVVANSKPESGGNGALSLKVLNVLDQTDGYHTNGTWDGLTYTAESHGGAGELSFTIPTTGTPSASLSKRDHAHGMVTSEGKIGSDGVLYANGCHLVVTDKENYVNRMSIMFLTGASYANNYLCQDGTFKEIDTSSLIGKDILEARGDIVYASAQGEPARLAAAEYSADKSELLCVGSSGAPEWEAWEEITDAEIDEL